MKKKSEESRHKQGFIFGGSLALFHIVGRIMVRLRITVTGKKMNMESGCKEQQITFQKYQKPSFYKCRFHGHIRTTFKHFLRNDYKNNGFFLLLSYKHFHQYFIFLACRKTYLFIFSANTRLILKNLEKKISFEGVYTKFSDFRQEYRFAIRRLERLKCEKCVKIYPHKIFCNSKVCFLSNQFKS